ncbi:MAG TPA: 4Fe-4S dicluster domain-containing protein [Xanthobacteraceae bacterium]|nr:4Fe-4S dicluster domain-containing protein [Xanthobacteraceae bacterium]
MKSTTIQVEGGRQFSRRDALQVLAAHMTLALAGCSKPAEEIVPYVTMPEGLTPGEPLKFATAVPIGGYGVGVLAISIDGRPIKIEGNPKHPDSLGSTDAFAEAAVMSLYDPDRSRTPTLHGSFSSWDAFGAALLAQLKKHRQNGGEGLRLLTGRITSPTLLRQIDDILVRFPQARWHVHEPIDENVERQGSALAFGRAMHSIPSIEKAEVVLCLDADPLGPGPSQIQNAHRWIQSRDPKRPEHFMRTYVAESTLTPTGIKADHRVALHPNGITDLSIAISNLFGAGLPEPTLSNAAKRFVNACGADLGAHTGRAVVLAGRTLPAEVHALVHWLNAALNAPIAFVEPFDQSASHEPAALRPLVEALHGGRVDALVVIDTNVGYDAPADLALAAALPKAAFSVHLGCYADETAKLCQWHLPQTHFLEGWSDLRGFDGSATIVQPLIRPLYATRSAHELLTMVAGEEKLSYDLVRDTWRPRVTMPFEDWWRQVLHDGVIPETAAQRISVAPPQRPQFPRGSASGEFTLVLSPDPSTWDGRYANSPWLQECPKPISKEVWGNALVVHQEDAARLHLTTGDVVRLSAQNHTLESPVLVSSHGARGVIHLSLGYGRTRAGAIGNSIGVSAYTLRWSDALWTTEVTIKKLNDRREVLTTQNYVRLAGEARDLFPIRLLDDARKVAGAKREGSLPSLYPPAIADTYAWGMVIDTAACIGCNACVVACQAENNVPVVGPEEIARGRDMHWLRVDIYDHGTDGALKAGFQPVPCMHCENAPCEPVCPVAASVHDSEGLNAQVYNRCVGTRFCEANCPYKVRRFNFFGYADGQEYANLGADTIKAQHNPEVSTRQRGVMEKCTYCVQRISRARRDAKREERTIVDGEVVTACQSACPTRAISFGNLNDKTSAVSAVKGEARQYALLEHLNTRPRTTYLADIRNQGVLKGEPS